MGCRATAIAVAVALGVFTTSANAGIVTVHFSGTIDTIDDPNGYISGSSVGDSFSGTLVYDTSLPEEGGTADHGYYTYLPGTTPPFATPLGITVTVGTHTFSAEYTSSMQIQVLNNTPDAAFPDVFGATAGVTVGGVHTLAALALGDSTGTVFSSTALPTSLNLADFDVGDFNLVSPTGPAGANIFAGTLNLNSVPEPTSALLLGVGIPVIAAFALRRRVKA